MSARTLTALCASRYAVCFMESQVLHALIALRNMQLLSNIHCLAWSLCLALFLPICYQLEATTVQRALCWSSECHEPWPALCLTWACCQR